MMVSTLDRVCIVSNTFLQLLRCLFIDFLWYFQILLGSYIYYSSNVSFEALFKITLLILIFQFTWVYLLWLDYQCGKLDLISSVMKACSSMFHPLCTWSVLWCLQPCELWSQLGIIYSYEQQQNMALPQAR